MSALRALRPTATTSSPRVARRAISTLPSNPHIYVFPESGGKSHLLTLLPSPRPARTLALGSTSQLPVTPQSFTENHAFFSILHSVLRQHATKDPQIQGQAAAFASTGGSGLGSGGALFPSQRRTERKRQSKAVGGGGGTGGDGAGGASAQGGMGGAGRGGWVHVSDMRNPPDYGRIAWPEDIFGSLEVDGAGQFIGEDGNYQESGTYRMVTNDGILGLTDFLREKLVQRLKKLEESNI